MNLYFKKQFLSNFFFGEKFSDNSFWSFFRISISLLILSHFLAIWSDFSLLFSNSGIIPADIPATTVKDYFITLPEIITFLEKLDIGEESTLITFKILFVCVTTCLLIGIYPKITSTLLLFLQIAYIKGGNFYNYGVDFFTTMSLFYLIVFPTDTSFRKTNKIKKINWTPFLRTFQIHLSITYFFSGFDKALGFNWRNGEAVWKAINLPYFNQLFHFDYQWLAHNEYILVFAGWFVIIIEGLYPIMIWFSKTRNLWLSLIISIHLGIAITLNLYFFSMIMIIWNLTCFYFPYKLNLNK